MRLLPATLLLLALLPVARGASAAATCPNPGGGWGVPGSGPGQFDLPDAIVRDRSNHWLVTDQHNNRVQVFDANGNFLSTFGSGVLFHPCGIAVGSDRLLYVAEHQNHRVSVFSESGVYIRNFGTFGVGPGQLSYPVAVDADAYGFIYVADSENARIQKYFTTGGFVRSLATGLLNHPYGVRYGPDGLLWVACLDGTIHRIDASTGAQVNVWGSAGSGPGQFYGPEMVTFGPDGRIYVSDTGNDRIQVFDSAMNFQCAFGSTGTGPANFDVPTDLEFDVLGQAVIADYGNNRIRIWGFSPTPAQRTTWGSLKLLYR